MTEAKTEAKTCTCRERLIDWRLRTVGHPYRACPFFDTITRLDDPPEDASRGR